MAAVQETEVEAENDAASPSNSNSFVERETFYVGDEVEVAREEKGYSGAWYEATIAIPPGSNTAHQDYSKGKRKKWGFWVQYKHLLADDGESAPLREYIRKRSLLRPAPPPISTTEEEDHRDVSLSFRVNDVVDAFHLAGWWTGVVVSVVVEGHSYRVAFKDPDEELEFPRHDLRLHRDWVDGNWIPPLLPQRKMALQLGNSSAAKDHTVKVTASSKKKLENSESRRDVVQPLKKLRSRKNVIEASESQHLPRPLVSGKVFTRKPRTDGSIDNQSSHSMEESTDCSLAQTADSTDRDCKKLGDVVERVVDRKLNDENIGTVVNVSILAAETPNVNSLKCTGDNDGKLGDLKVQIVEDSSRRSANNLSDCGSLAVPQGVEKQVHESNLHDTVNELNATNQAELTATNGINISAGNSAVAVQPCVGTQQAKEMPDVALGSITMPEPSLVLPFQKYSTVWKVIESMEIFAKFPQNPHFSPLAEHEEEKREELALQKMLKYAFIGEKISKLTTADLKSSVVTDLLTSLKDLEECGFDVMSIKRHLNDLLSNYERQNRFCNKLEEVEGRIRNCNLEKIKAENEIRRILMKIKDLEKELMSAKNMIETMDQEIMELRSEESAIHDEIRHIQLDFEGTAALLKRMFC